MAGALGSDRAAVGLKRHLEASASDAGEETLAKVGRVRDVRVLGARLRPSRPRSVSALSTERDFESGGNVPHPR